MLFGATVLVICAHKRRSPERRWIWYCPVAFLLLSLAQATNTLWGFQMAWYLVLLMTALALFLLDQEPQRWLVFGCAIAAAVIASFSSLQGLLVWPAGLLLIYLRRRPRHLAIAWIGSAVLAGAIYFVGFNFNLSQSASQDPADLLTGFVRVVGDIVGESQPGVLVTVFGSVLVVTAIWALVRFATQERTTTGGRPFALSLILLGLLFSGLTAYGRSGDFGVGIGVEYRYTVFAIFVLLGLYLAVLDPPLASDLRSPEHGAPSSAGSAGQQRHVFSDPLFALARVVVGVGIVLTVILRIGQRHLPGGSDTRYPALCGTGDRQGQPVPGLDRWPSYRGRNRLQIIRHWITIARDDRLSLFATGDAARYLSERPIQYTLSPLRAVVFLPRSGSTVHGKQILDVWGSGSYDLTRVEYLLSGPGLAESWTKTGVSTVYGWVAKWNTSAIPNGTYTIEAKVSDSRGRTVMTPTVEVRVENAHSISQPGLR